MRAYTVHGLPRDPSPERFAFVKDGICWPALFIPLLWMLWHRMWVVLLGYIAFALVVGVIDEFVGEPYAVIAGIGGALILWLEGNAIRRFSLQARGWREIGDAVGRNLAEAEIRFFAGWAKLPPLKREALLAGAAHKVASPVADADAPILGLFPEPDR